MISSTLTHQEHEMDKELKVTQASIKKDEETLKKMTARHSHPETNKDERMEMYPEMVKLDQKIKYDQKQLEYGNRLGKNGSPVIGAGRGFEITRKVR